MMGVFIPIILGDRKFPDGDLFVGFAEKKIFWLEIFRILRYYVGLSINDMNSKEDVLDW